MAYAETTTVSVEKTEAEIKATLRRYGATRFMSGEEPKLATIAFEMKERRIIFRLPLPEETEARFQFDGRRVRRSAESRQKVWEQACRSRWRALFLCIKAKLESVESGIESFDEAFMPHIALPDGSTVGERSLPSIATIYATGKMQPLLPPPRPAEEAGRAPVEGE